MKNKNAAAFVFSLGRQLAGAVFAALLFTVMINAQTTLFKFETKLPNEVTPATDVYQMEFKLFDAAAGGTQVGATNVVGAVDVQNRSFSVWLDFGAAAFSGPDRYIEISYRRNSTQPFATVPTRERVLSVPYAIRALNATSADSITGVDLSDFVLTTDPRLSDDRDPLPGSGHYIQNRTSQQPTSNFSISGNGRAAGTLTGNIVSATTQFNIGSLHMLSGSSSNVFAGVGAGDVTTGINNSFFGRIAGQVNTSGTSNSFFGSFSGRSNTTGSNNSYFGFFAGENATGSDNAAFGDSAGSLAAGSRNSFFGTGAGGNTSATGNNNTFIGLNADFVVTSNVASSFNTLLGANAKVDQIANAASLNFATAIGAGAVVSESNRVQLGRDGFDSVAIGFFANATATPVCRSGQVLALCSSSRRYKENVLLFDGGLDMIKRFRPVTFDWIEHKNADIGLIAEEVARVEPLLVTHNRNGEIEGVKYDQLSVVLISAVKEQQAEIEFHQKQIATQQAVIDKLEKRLTSLEKKKLAKKTGSASVARKRR
ncbi:MAG TPA: tail fiber domain-containing protein [Pyrinomonadaceae bacterium]|nr:tail fiber domain-containing protein [Pyrinomonadaceae bacterium]